MNVLRVGQVGADHDLFIVGMAAQHREGVVMAGFDDALQFGLKFRTRHVFHPVMLTVEACPTAGALRNANKPTNDAAGQPCCWILKRRTSRKPGVGRCEF
jgi:hypothetical protein